MGDMPTVQECRDHLEGYNITTSILSTAWITDEMTYNVLPMVEQITGDLSAAETITDYLSGNGGKTLILHRRNSTITLVSITLVSSSDIIGTIPLTSVELIAKEGILRAKTLISEGLYFPLFPHGQKNIKVVYTIGGSVPDDIEMAIKKLTCITMLDNLEGRTGGGALTVQGFSRQYGDKGKYTNIRNRLNRAATTILKRYTSAVVGS